MDLRHYLVAAFGLVILAKAVWAILSPSSMKRAAEVCLSISGKVNTLLGVLYMGLGMALWIVVLANQQIVDWVLLAFGVSMVLGGILYFRHERIRGVVEVALLNRENAFVRLLGILMVLVAGALVWVGVRGW